MTVLYRGAGVGTYWQVNDARLSGFTPKNPGLSASPDRVIQHVYNGLTDSPFVSLTLSYGVALNYALEMGVNQPTLRDPACVYEVEINAAHKVSLIDPVREVAVGAPNPLDPNPYQHNGHPNIILGVAWPLLASLLRMPVPMPPGSTTTATPIARVGPHLWAMVAALRDSEILAVGVVPAACVVKRYSIY